jgi:hypothetical protein
VLCLLGEHGGGGGAEPSSSLKTMWNSSVESPIMARYGLSPWGHRSEQFLVGEATACQTLTVGRDGDHR